MSKSNGRCLSKRSNRFYPTVIRDVYVGGIL